MAHRGFKRKGKQGEVGSNSVVDEALIDVWIQAAGITEGYIFRTLRRGGFITRNCVDGQTIFSVVTYWSKKCGLKVAADDLRRTFAKLAWKGGASIEQVSLALGHSSIQTTEVYLGIELDLSDSAADHLGLRVRV